MKSAWAERTRTWNFEMTMYFLTTLSDPALGVSRTFMSDNQRQGVLFTNHSGYANPKVDDLFRRAASSVNEAERKAMYSEIQKIMVDEVAVAWLVELVWPTVYNKKLHNVVTDGVGPNGNFAETWLEK
jgi:peptide/nickel transport system substrate-binding protein